MRVVIAVKPGTGGEWIEAALRRLPLPDPLDIVLVSAVHIPRPPLTSPGRHARGLYWAAVGVLRTEAERAAKRTTDLLQQRLARRASRVAVRILAAQPAIAIVQAATAWGAELILTGGPSRGALGRALLGSVPADVVRMAACPVLVAGPRVGQMRRVLAATDGSLHAEAALRFLAALPVPPSSEVRVCAIAEVSSPGWVAPLLTRWRQKHEPPHTELQHRAALRSLARAQAILAGFFLSHPDVTADGGRSTRTDGRTGALGTRPAGARGAWAHRRPGRGTRQSDGDAARPGALPEPGRESVKRVCDVGADRTFPLQQVRGGARHVLAGTSQPAPHSGRGLPGMPGHVETHRPPLRPLLAPRAED